MKRKIEFERDLIPCPGCGSSDHLRILKRVITFHDQNERYQVSCDHCGWTGPEGRSAAAARQIWDHRRDRRPWVRMAIEALIKVQREYYGWSARIHPEDREKWDRYERSIQILEGMESDPKKREAEK